MNVRELIVFLNRVKVWMPQSNVMIRNEIDALIAQLKRQINH
jgi:hypothetical protein